MWYTNVVTIKEQSNIQIWEHPDLDDSLIRMSSASDVCAPPGNCLYMSRVGHPLPADRDRLAGQKGSVVSLISIARNDLQDGQPMPMLIWKKVYSRVRSLFRKLTSSYKIEASRSVATSTSSRPTKRIKLHINRLHRTFTVKFIYTLIKLLGDFE